MKKYIILFLLSVVTLNLSAQWKTYPKLGEYIQDSNLDKFVGKWQGTKNDTTFTIVFMIEKHIKARGGFYYDALVGWHEVKVNGKVIESSLGKVGDMSLGSRTCGVGMVNQVYGVNFRFKDITRKKSDQATFLIDSTNTNKATWSIRNTEMLSKAMCNIGSDGIGRYDARWTVPTDLIMYRIK
jgi:hypothetical protein